MRRISSPGPGTRPARRYHQRMITPLDEGQITLNGRNITDEQIKACAATGGVICINGVSFFLGATTPTAADVARHVAYVADLVGVDHVGIGLDISFSQPELDDTPPGDYDPTYWWPKSAGYDRALGWGYVEPAPVTGAMTTAGVASVAICVGESLVMIVAMTLPPRAGRVCLRIPTRSWPPLA